jgi:hypothetical protein
LKKPNLDNDFVGMENDWEGPPGFTRRPEGPKFDQPWNMSYGAVSNWIVIFDLRSDSTYCPGDTRNFEIRGSHPIYFLELFGEREGTYLTIYGGYGTNSVTGAITASADQKGSIIFNGSMTTSGGQVGASNYLMPEGRDCCDADLPLLPDPASTPETIAQNQVITIYVLDGEPPFTWSKVDDGVCYPRPENHYTLLDDQTSIRQVDLSAASFATGAVEISCIDSCGTEVIQTILCTTGSWLGVEFECVLPGSSTSYEAPWEFRTVGCRRQGFSRSNSRTDLTSANCTTCGATPFVQDHPQCMTWDCTNIGGSLTTTCNWARCAHPTNPWCSEVKVSQVLQKWF